MNDSTNGIKHALLAGGGAVFAMIACSTSAGPPSADKADASVAAPGTSGEAGSRDPIPGPSSPDASDVPDASGAPDGGGACPKTSCATYATRSDACDPGKGRKAWEDVCTNAAAKCKGASLPDCFCAPATDCDALRWCGLSPCEQ